MSEGLQRELKDRNQSLDALRGLAASLVLIVHASETYSNMAEKYGHSVWLYKASLAVDIGRVGVVLFFLISGFAVANSLRQAHSSVGGFLIRRFFRLYPLFWLSVFLAAWFQLSGPISTSTIAANLTMVPELFGVTQMLGIYWTLEIELIAYGVTALLFMSGLFNKALVTAGLCLLLVVAFALMMFGALPAARILQWQMLPHNLALILWGGLFHLAFSQQTLTNQHSGKPDWRRSLTMAMMLVVLSPSLYSSLQYFIHGRPDNLRWGISYPLAFALFLISFFHIRRVPRFLVWLGQISYSTYLLHPLVITLLILSVPEISGAANFIGVPLFVVISLFATTALAGFLFSLIEKPAILFGKKLENLYRSR